MGHIGRDAGSSHQYQGKDSPQYLIYSDIIFVDADDNIFITYCSLCVRFMSKQFPMHLITNVPCFSRTSNASKDRVIVEITSPIILIFF